MFSKRTFIIALLLLAVFAILLSAGAVWSAYGLEETAEAAKLPMNKDVPTLIGNIIGAILSLVGVFFFGLMIYGGFLWMTAHGNAETEKKALATIMAAIIGIIIILASYAITNFVFENIKGGGGQPTTTPSGDSKYFVENPVLYCNINSFCSDNKKANLCLKSELTSDKGNCDTLSESDIKVCCVTQGGTKVEKSGAECKKELQSFAVGTIYCTKEIACPSGGISECNYKFVGDFCSYKKDDGTEQEGKCSLLPPKGTCYCGDI